MADDEKPEWSGGQWPKGYCPNPKGRPRGIMTWQDYADRIDYYLSGFTRGQIKALVMDVDEFDKLVSRDAMIVQTMAEAFSGEGLLSRKELLSRVIGESMKRGELTGANGTALFGDDDKAAIRSKLTTAAIDSGARPDSIDSE